jgi:hypothetical protein
VANGHNAGRQDRNLKKSARNGVRERVRVRIVIQNVARATCVRVAMCDVPRLGCSPAVGKNLTHAPGSSGRGQLKTCKKKNGVRSR